MDRRSIGLQQCTGCDIKGPVVTMVSRPRVKSMRKKMIAQKGESGSLVRASGYTTNAMPGPVSHTSTHINIQMRIYTHHVPAEDFLK